jgi:hypothetical protein
MSYGNGHDKAERMQEQWRKGHGERERERETRERVDRER